MARGCKTVMVASGNDRYAGKLARLWLDELGLGAQEPTLIAV